MSRGLGTPKMLAGVAVAAPLLASLAAVQALAAPAVTIESGPGGPTNDTTPTFGFTVAGATVVECSIDQGTEAFGPCTDAASHTAGPLADGDWTFRVRASDDVPETSTETRTFTVDTLAPSAYVFGPQKTEERRPSFTVSSPDPEATLTCRLDSRPEVPCGPTFKPSRRLSYGVHRLVVTAHDAAQNSGPPDSLRFRILWPPLEGDRAERTVATALRRHDFAKRVIQNLERRCERRGRYKFACRFSSSFPGYRLKGRGPVELRKGRISYRFVVRAQGRRLVLSDENEGSFPGKLESAQHGKP